MTDTDTSTQEMLLDPDDVDRSDLVCDQLDHASFRVTHEPTGKYVEYVIPPFARGMALKDQYDLAKDKIAREGFAYDPAEAP